MNAFCAEQRAGIRLFALAFLTLYFELALIRFASAEVLYLGYFSNYVLIAVFLGLGLGFLAAKREASLFRALPQAILAFVAFVLATKTNVNPLRAAEDNQLYFASTSPDTTLPLWVTLVLLFGGTVFMFAAVAQETARCFARYRPITAYSIDIGGSLAGIVAFTLHAYLGGSPLAWLAVVFGLIAGLSPRRTWANVSAMGLAVGLIVVATTPAHYVRWSPYQKIEVTPMGSGFHLAVNGIGHQTMHSPGEKEPIYDVPYREVMRARGGKGYQQALIIGAGSGTDLAYALHYGVGHIDAVEIDPEIQRAGALFHPGRPYASERVTVHIQDGRAFMHNTSKRYDLILYALPDSLALVSSFSSIRLESFLFTLESFSRARSLLTDDGALVLYNYYRRGWLLEKLAAMLQEVFGHPPLVVEYGSEAQGLLAALAIGPKLGGAPRAHGSPALASDDWPFLYMERRHMPALYVWAMLLFVGAAALGITLVGPSTWKGVRANGPFLLMGAAFLLLETKSVIQLSLLFGATWMVNALVFFAILTSVLFANWVVAARKLHQPHVLFALLFLVLLLNVLLPLRWLLGIEPVALRYVLSSLILFSPIFVANLVFGRLFRDAEHAASAFGWNVMGAMLGGALEYTSLLLGYGKLTLVVGSLYAACAVWAYVLRARSSSRGVPG